MSKIFKVPFAATGDKESVPTSTQPDGKVSYEQGFGHDYQKPYEDPEAKDIAREDFNQILFDITDAIGEAQVHGVSKWGEEGKPYPKNALVYHNDKVWQSKANNNNSAPSEGSNWGEVSISDLAKANEIPTAGTGIEQDGRDFKVKYGTSSGTAVQGSTRINGKALSGAVTITKADVGLGNVTNDTQAKAQTEIKAGAGLTGGGTLAADRTISVKFGTGSNDVARGNDGRITGALQKSQNLADLASRSVARNNLGLGSAATRYVVSSATDTSGGNKVVTQGWMGLGSSVPVFVDNLNDADKNMFFYFSGSSDNHPTSGDGAGITVGWIPPDEPNALEGDVFQLVTTRGGNDLWIRGADAADSNGNPNWIEWKNIMPLGVEQTWQDVLNSRTAGTTYTNTTGRPIVVNAGAIEDAEVNVTIIGYVNNMVVAHSTVTAPSGSGGVAFVSFIVPSGATYRCTLGTNDELHHWVELR